MDVNEELNCENAKKVRVGRCGGWSGEGVGW